MSNNGKTKHRARIPHFHKHLVLIGIHQCFQLVVVTIHVDVVHDDDCILLHHLSHAVHVFISHLAIQEQDIVLFSLVAEGIIHFFFVITNGLIDVIIIAKASDTVRIWTLPTHQHLHTPLLDHKQTIAKRRTDSEPLLSDTQVMVHVASRLAVVQQRTIRASFTDVQATCSSGTLHEKTLSFQPGTQRLDFKIVEGIAVTVTPVDDQPIVVHHRYVTTSNSAYSHGNLQTTRM